MYREIKHTEPLLNCQAFFFSFFCEIAIIFSIMLPFIPVNEGVLETALLRKESVIFFPVCYNTPSISSSSHLIASFHILKLLSTNYMYLLFAFKLFFELGG